jgi:hypothetical protein
MMIVCKVFGSAIYGFPSQLRLLRTAFDKTCVDVYSRARWLARRHYGKSSFKSLRTVQTLRGIDSNGPIVRNS